MTDASVLINFLRLEKLDLLGNLPEHEFLVPDHVVEEISDPTQREQLEAVERAFRTLKSIDLKVRPIRHWVENRVRAHIFLCMLAYYVEWHMIEAWRPLLFADEDQEGKKERDPVAPARRSESALVKVWSHVIDDGTVVHSFQTLMKDLGSIVRNTCRRKGAAPSEATFEITTTPSAKQARAFALLKPIRV